MDENDDFEIVAHIPFDDYRKTSVGTYCTYTYDDGTCFNSHWYRTLYDLYRSDHAGATLSPLGDQVLVAVNPGERTFKNIHYRSCYPGSDNNCLGYEWSWNWTESPVYRVDLASGQSELVWTAPGRVFWMGASADGNRLVAGVGVARRFSAGQYGSPRTHDTQEEIEDCAIYAYDLRAGTLIHPPVPNDRACTWSRFPEAHRPAIFSP